MNPDRIRSLARSIGLELALASVQVLLLELAIAHWGSMAIEGISERAPGALALTVLMVAGLQHFLGRILGSRVAGWWLVATFNLLLFAAQISKLLLLGQPLQSSDLSLGVISAALLSLDSMRQLTLGLWLVFALAGAAFWMWRERAGALSSRDRALGLIGLLPFLAISWGLDPLIREIPTPAYERPGVPRIWGMIPLRLPVGYLERNYSVNGTWIGLLSYLRLGRLNAFAHPEVAPRASAEGVARLLGGSLPMSPSGAREADVLILMLESWMDPADLLIPRYMIPWPALDRLADEAIARGKVRVPTYGGESAATEFELLTGFPMANFRFGLSPFLSLLHEEYPSFARLFERRGYRTVAMNDFPVEIENSTRGYRMLGFQKVVDRTLLQGEVQGKAPMRSDEKLLAAILPELEHPGPQLIHAFANGTHGLYEHSAPLANPDIFKPRVSAPTAFRLGNYFGLFEALDQRLGPFFEALRERKRPTLVLVMGDHQPAFPLDSLRELHLIGPTETRRGEPFYRVPYVLWGNPAFRGVQAAPSNRSERSRRKARPAPALSAPRIEDLGVPFLLLRVLGELGLESRFTRFLRSVEVGVGSGDPAALEALRTIQYDVIFGANHTRELWDAR